MIDQPRRPLTWAAGYTAVCAATKPLEGDKILLPQSALEQLLAAATTTVPSTDHAFTAFDPFNPYSVAAAREERARAQETVQPLPHPLMFRLTNQSNGNSVYAGIREFSAADTDVVLSPYVADALGVEDAPADTQITVKADQLPKGTYVRLRPLEAGYNADDWKSLLERQLSARFTTLTKGAVLAVQGVKGEDDFRFLVDKVEPDGDAICVVDTDLEVDIEPLNEEQARETLRRNAAQSQRAAGTEAGSSIGGVIDIGKDVEGQVIEGEYVDYELPSWDRCRPMSIELQVLEDEAEMDLFVSPRSTRHRAAPRDSEHVFADVTSPNDGRKEMVLQPTHAALDGAESLAISVHGFVLPNQRGHHPHPRRYRLRTKAVDQAGTCTAPIDPSGPGPEHGSPDEERCDHCHQWIPKRTMMLHDNFCRRNNVVCPQCGNVFQKSSSEWTHHWHCPTHPDACGSSAQSKSKHDYYQHTEHTCPSCGPSRPFTFPSLPELARHRTTTCPHKLILCRFCHLEVAQEGDPLDPASGAETVISGLTAHERADGTRTTDCHRCGSIVRLRDMAAHQANHELDKAVRAKPAICRSALCGRTLHGVGPRGQVGGGGGGGGGGTRAGQDQSQSQSPGNDLGLCSLCFGPLYVSMYDPEGKALRRRIERRYLGQVLAGCAKAWCVNPWCRTGRAHAGLEPLGVSGAAGALPLVRPLVDAVRDDARPPLHFCVDEAGQKRRRTAELLAGEAVWELAWCVAALEAEGGDVARARGWLQDWAPANGTARGGKTQIDRASPGRTACFL